MKNFNEPELNILKILVQDVITTSGGIPEIDKPVKDPWETERG